MHANHQRPQASWSFLALIATSILCSGGCAKLYHEWHYNFATKSLHEHRLSYYHSPHTGRIIPNEHHRVCPIELPCFGYEPTCWHRWPEGCVRCPVDAGHVVVNGPYAEPGVVEEVIMQPTEGDAMPPAGEVDGTPEVQEDPAADLLDEASDAAAEAEDALDTVPEATDGAAQPEPHEIMPPLAQRSSVKPDIQVDSTRNEPPPSPAPVAQAESAADTSERSERWDETVESTESIPNPGNDRNPPARPANSSEIHESQALAADTVSDTRRREAVVLPNRMADLPAAETAPVVAPSPAVAERGEPLTERTAPANDSPPNQVVEAGPKLPEIPTARTHTSSRRVRARVVHSTTRPTAVQTETPDKDATTVVAVEQPRQTATAKALPVATEKSEQPPSPPAVNSLPAATIPSMVSTPRLAEDQPVPTFSIVPAKPQDGAIDGGELRWSEPSSVRFVTERPARPARVADRLSTSESSIRFR